MKSTISPTKPFGAAVVLLAISVATYGQGNIFKKIRYQGGTVVSTVKPDDSNNTLTVSAEEISLKFKDGKEQKIDPKHVTGLSYGQVASRKIKTMIALAVFLTPLALFGLMHKDRKHFSGMEWQDADGKKGGVLLQAKKDDYRGVLMALRGATGAPVTVSAEERKYVPTGIETVTTENEKKPEKDKPKP